MLLKKVVVLFPYPDPKKVEPNVDASLGQKTFTGKSLEVLNKSDGCLVIKEINGHTYAVFKHWIYWENIK